MNRLWPYGKSNSTLNAYDLLRSVLTDKVKHIKNKYDKAPHAHKHTHTCVRIVKQDLLLIYSVDVPLHFIAVDQQKTERSQDIRGVFILRAKTNYGFSEIITYNLSSFHFHSQEHHFPS